MIHPHLRSTGLILALVAVAGCHRRANVTTAPPPTTPLKSVRGPGATAAPLSKEQLALKPNEAGMVPILMYHSIDVKGVGRYKADQVGSYVRSPEGFRKELQRMYDDDYRPVTLSEYLDNKIGIPLGKSPVVLTFDDARETQFRNMPDGSVDPDCAIGIMQEFARTHPDFPARATFFVQPSPGTHTGFGQPELTLKKMQALVAMGCEIQNHTLTHANLRNLSDDKVQREIAQCQQEIQKMLPGAKVDEFALPFGVSPRNKALATDGQSGGIRYHNRAVMLVGAGPARAVISKRFKPTGIPRIQAADVNPAFPDSSVCSIALLEQIKTNHTRYVSDGDANITTIPKSLESRIEPKRLNGSALRTY